ncbi:unnamed protein product [Sphagnum balticum]
MAIIILGFSALVSPTLGWVPETDTFSGTIVGGRFQRVHRLHLPPVFVETPRPPHPPPTAFQRNPTRE